VSWEQNSRGSARALKNQGLSRGVLRDKPPIFENQYGHDSKRYPKNKKVMMKRYPKNWNPPKKIILDTT